MSDEVRKEFIISLEERYNKVPIPPKPEPLFGVIICARHYGVDTFLLSEMLTFGRADA